MTINPLSFHPADIYSSHALELDWTATHSGYTLLTTGASYTEMEREWQGEHSCYGDLYAPSGPKEPTLPDLKTMLAVMHPLELDQDQLDDAITSVNVSNTGTVWLTLRRDWSPRDQAVPLTATSLRINVVGTDISSWIGVSPGSSPTVDVSLPGVPAGIHTVEVEIYSEGRLLGTTRQTVKVRRLPSHRFETIPETIFEPEPEPPFTLSGRGAYDPNQTEPMRPSSKSPTLAPESNERRGDMKEFRPTILGDDPARLEHTVHSGQPPSGQARTGPTVVESVHAGHAMASGQGISYGFSSQDTDLPPHEFVKPIEAGIAGFEGQGHGNDHGHHHHPTWIDLVDDEHET